MGRVLAIRYKVNPEKLDDFEQWKSQMESAISSFEGYIDTVHIRPVERDDYHYIILRFDSKNNLQRWINSEYRVNMHNESNGLWISEKEEAIHDWDTFWFSKMKKMKKWKQWAVTFLAVYPLTVIIPPLVNKYGDHLSLSFVKGIISAVLISGFMTFLVMPFMLKLFKKWLHR